MTERKPRVCDRHCNLRAPQLKGVPSDSRYIERVRRGPEAQVAHQHCGVLMSLIVGDVMRSSVKLEVSSCVGVQGVQASMWCCCARMVNGRPSVLCRV